MNSSWREFVAGYQLSAISYQPGGFRLSPQIADPIFGYDRKTGDAGDLFS